MIPKFRAWLKEELEMQDVLAFDTRGHSFLGIEGTNVRVEGWCDYFEVDKQAVIMQSTGLKDTNGIESWEGNYLTKEGCWPFFIKWIENEGCLMAVPVNSVQKTNWKPVSVKELLDKGYVNNSNIYENPELLEGTE
ncbi:YopX family protein [Enterococcus faecalis]|uniref:YopX family protein n=1 Tax=Enterococcus faecalis TaxID=1351 RepID=UPI0013875558|nr:YopX family protein [Enterococcus faecalis]MEB7428468.1 YopX family protein [Enterococcus faecalis]